jgi:hypothetical protein
MVYTTLFCVFVLLSRAHAIPGTPIATEPIISTITLSTVTQSLSTFASLATETSTIFDISARTTTTDGAVIASPTTLGLKSVEIVQYTTTGVSAVSVTGVVVVVSTVGLTTIYAADAQVSSSPTVFQCS